MPLVTLVGYRCSGKSAVAAALAKQFGCPWVDADDVLEHEAGTSIADLVGTRGEPFFRDLESRILAELLDDRRGILATGGGVVLREANRQLLKTLGRPVVWLTAPGAIIRDRLAKDPSTASRRPSLAGGDVIDEVDAAMSARAPFYREVADGMIDTAVDASPDLASRIATWLSSARPEQIP